MKLFPDNSDNKPASKTRLPTQIQYLQILDANILPCNNKVSRKYAH